MVAKLYAGRFQISKSTKKEFLPEAQTSTGLGDGIAMPHAKNSAVKEATVLFAKSNAGCYEVRWTTNVPLLYDRSTRRSK